MNIHANVMNRVLTQEFYRANAMFFLVVIGFCFGFMRGAEHVALAGYFVGSVWLVMIPVGVWMFYTIKVILFNKHEIRNDRNVFMAAVPLVPFAARSYAYVVVAIGQLMPAIAYGLFLIAVASKNGQFIQIIFITVSLVILVIITSWHIHRSLVHPEKEHTITRPVRWLDKRMSKSMPWMFMEGIVRLQPGAIYTTKIATCLVIYGATNLYVYENYDARLYSMAACAAFGANLALVYQYQRFEVMHLLLLRTLPLRLITRVRSLIITMIALCFPEIAMLATNLPEVLQLQDYAYALVFGLSMLVFGYGALYVRDVPFDSFSRVIFFVTMGWTILILFKVPLMIGVAVHLIAGGYLLVRNFYSFELDPQP